MMTYESPVGFHFRVDFSTLTGASHETRFQEVSGLNMELGVEEFAEGGENRFVHRLPDRAKYRNLILKRGLLTQSSLIKWCKLAIEQFIFQPIQVNVTLLNEENAPVECTYSFVNSWPVKWSVSDFKAQDNALAIETLELAYSYFTKISL